MQESSAATALTATFAAVAFVDDLPQSFRFPLIDLATPALRRMESRDRAEFLKTLEMLFRAETEFSLTSYGALHMLRRSLNPIAAMAPLGTLRSFRALRADCLSILSFLSHAGRDTPEQAIFAFRKGAARLSQPSATLLPRERGTVERLDSAFKKMRKLAPALKQFFVTACVECLLADGRASENDIALLRGITAVLDCPMPPFLNTGESRAHEVAS